MILYSTCIFGGNECPEILILLFRIKFDQFSNGTYWIRVYFSLLGEKGHSQSRLRKWNGKSWIRQHHVTVCSFDHRHLSSWSSKEMDVDFSVRKELQSACRAIWPRSMSSVRDGSNATLAMKTGALIWKAETRTFSKLCEARYIKQFCLENGCFTGLGKRSTRKNVSQLMITTIALFNFCLLLLSTPYPHFCGYIPAELPINVALSSMLSLRFNKLKIKVTIKAPCLFR